MGPLLEHRGDNGCVQKRAQIREAIDRRFELSNNVMEGDICTPWRYSEQGRVIGGVRVDKLGCGTNNDSSSTTCHDKRNVNTHTTHTPHTVRESALTKKAESSRRKRGGEEEHVHEDSKGGMERSI